MKYLTSIIALLVLVLLSSCHNEDILIEDSTKCEVNVTVDLTHFFSCYDFIDTRHSFNLEKNKRFKSHNAAEIYESRCTRYDSINSSAKIKARILFYNDNGVLEDDDSKYVEDYTNPANKTVNSKTFKLPTGKYTVIAILTFGVERLTSDENWTLKDKENLKTACLEHDNAGTIWSIMSYASQEEFEVGAKKPNKLEMTPTPVGALCYAYFQNFQENNKINSIRACTNKFAKGFMLDPYSSNRYIFRENYNLRKNFLVFSQPGDYSDNKDYFQGDVFDFFYILAPQCDFYYYYYDDKGPQEWPVGNNQEQEYVIESGKTYLAYWDYNDVDHPYFGIADNDHWH